MTPEALSHLTPDQKRIAIAEACGWTGCYTTDRYVTGVDPAGIERDIPNYLTDLNAMHEVEKVLTPQQRGFAYLANLSLVMDVEGLKEIPNRAFATAAQRADAFLLTL